MFEQSKWELPFALFPVHEHLVLVDSPRSNSEYSIFYKVGSLRIKTTLPPHSQWSSVSVYVLCLRTAGLIFKGDSDPMECIFLNAFLYSSNSLIYSIFTSLQCWFICDFM